MSSIQTRKEVLLNAISATSVSNGVGVDNAGRLSIMFFASGITGGSGVLTVEVTNDPTLGWVVYNRLTTNVVNSISEGDVRVASASVTAGAATAILFFPPGDTFNYIRARLSNLSTGGAFSAVLYLN